MCVNEKQKQRQQHWFVTDLDIHYIQTTLLFLPNALFCFSFSQVQCNTYNYTYIKADIKLNIKLWAAKI